MSENKIPYKIYLSEDEMPRAWYNLRSDMKNKPGPFSQAPPAPVPPIRRSLWGARPAYLHFLNGLLGVV